MLVLLMVAVRDIVGVAVSELPGGTGEKVEVIIPPEKYTAVRWIPSEPINANEEQVFTYRIQVK